MLLKSGAAKARGTKQKADRSLLAGKLFDETGDRLTPSHSRKNGKRLRYYISRRLVIDRSNKHPDAWRLPAEQLETLVAKMVQEHVVKPTTATAILWDASAAEVVGIQKCLSNKRSAAKLLGLVKRIDLQPGPITVRLDQECLSDLLCCKPEHLNPDALTITSNFRMRRRGVELKLHLGEAPSEIDHTLVQNIVTAQKLLKMVIGGKSIKEIAAGEAIPAPRIQALLNLAMLSPDVLDLVASGKQPTNLTTDYLLKTGFPTVWPDQQTMLASL